MKLVSILLILLFYNIAYASHAAGGYINYKPTGNPNEYEITMTVYRDCSGINYGISRGIKITNTCNSSNSTTIVLPLESLTEISQFCPQDLTNTECNNGSYPGFEKRVFKDTIVLNGLCDEWILSCQVNARNATINGGGGDMYIETKLNNLDFPLNASPIRNIIFPIPVVGAGKIHSLSLYFNDPDHDSLKFIFVNALNATGQPVSYFPPFTANQPISRYNN